MLIGRSKECEIILADPHASRRHALVYLGNDGPELVVLGKHRCTVSGRTVAEGTRLQHGETVELPGLVLAVDQESVDHGDDDAHWVLERTGGGLFGVAHSRFTIGGDSTDHLQVSELPPRALILHLAQGRLWAEASDAAKLTVRDTEVPSGELQALNTGDRLAIGGVGMRVLAGGDLGEDSTVDTSGYTGPDLPRSVRLSFLPRGGRLVIEFGRSSYETYLADRRCDLVATLLQPPSPYSAGELVPDPVVIEKVWPGKSMGRTDLNVLVHRLRKDLIRCGVDAKLVVRARGGGATRFSLGDGAKVTIE